MGGKRALVRVTSTRSVNRRATLSFDSGPNNNQLHSSSLVSLLELSPHSATVHQKMSAGVFSISQK